MRLLSARIHRLSGSNLRHGDAWLDPRSSAKNRETSPKTKADMANIKSQIKRNRQNEVRRQRNKAVRSELKTRAKSAVAAAESGDQEAATEALRLAQRRIDKAAAGGILKKNTAARHKSQLTRQVARILAG